MNELKLKHAGEVADLKAQIATLKSEKESLT